jgi:hypothetical protein
MGLQPKPEVVSMAQAFFNGNWVEMWLVGDQEVVAEHPFSCNRMSLTRAVLKRCQ